MAYLTLTAQPPAKDTDIQQVNPNTNYGAFIDIAIYNQSAGAFRSILEFNISSLPAGAVIKSANLRLYYYGHPFTPDPVGKTVWAYKLTHTDWVELEAAWNIYKAGSNWATAGGDYVTSNPSGGSTTVPASYGWMTWDVLAIVQNAYANSKPAEFLIKFEAETESSETATLTQFHSKEYTANPDLQPKLVIEYIVAPTVTTQACTAVEATTATGNGTITATGGENCTRRGFCYKVGTSGDPTTADSVAYNDGSFPAGAYTKGLTSLTPATNYRVRAYAVNSAGTGYGTTIQILTRPAAPTEVSATDGAYTDKVVVTWTKSTGAEGYRVYRDGVGLGWLGDVATYNDTGADAPTITPGAAAASDGLYVDKVALSLSGQSTSNGTTHTYKVRAWNSTGESADSGTNTGYRGHDSLIYQWQRSAEDSDAGYSNIAGATSASYNDTGAPAPTITPGSALASDGAYVTHVALSLSGQSANVGAGRYYRCLVSATGAGSQYSTADRGYRSVGALTYQWQRSAGDSDASYSDISGATTASYSDTSAPTDGSGRYYRCIENATGAAEQTSTSNRGYRATYYSSGYIGDVIDCTALVNIYDRLEWTKELAGQDIEVEIRSSPDEATWSTWETIYSSPCTSFSTPVQRYLEWRATLSSDTMATPKLNDLTFNWTKKVE